MVYIPSGDEQLSTKWFGIVRCSLPSSLLGFLELVPLGDRSLVESGPYQSYEAAYNLEVGMRDGLTLNQAKASILKDGYSDGSAACLSSIKHEIHQMPNGFPRVHQALYKRTRR